VFPTREDRAAGRSQDVQLMTIWFGANDAVHEGLPQYVPLPKFKANLRTLVDNVRNQDSKWYSPNTRLVLVSCPPIIEEERQLGQLARWREFGSKGEPPKLDRDAENTKAYAMAVVEVGRELDVPTVDLWHAVVDAAGGDEPDKLKPFF
jgi:lysophospholipase L1-like esterase